MNIITVARKIVEMKKKTNILINREIDTNIRSKNRLNFKWNVLGMQII